MSNTNLSLTASQAATATQPIYKGYRRMRSYSEWWLQTVLAFVLCAPIPPLWLLPIGSLLCLFITSRFTYYEVGQDYLIIKQNLSDRLEWSGCYSELHDAWIERAKRASKRSLSDYITRTATICIRGNDNDGIVKGRTESGFLEITGDVDEIRDCYKEIRKRIRLAKRGQLP